MNKILIISGPTATGKTSLAVQIATELGGEIISADSRQVYRGLDIGVGKDHPKGTPIHLIDVVEPSVRFSVSSYKEMATKVISSLHKKGALPIIVGCSGMYVDSIINQKYSTFGTKPNKILRLLLENLPTSTLRFLLKLIDHSTYIVLNNSDINNPRRLVRKIELKLTQGPAKNSTTTQPYDILHVSLTAPNDFLYSRINKRVDSRLEMGHLSELDTLLSKYKWADPGLQVSCYRVFREYYRRRLPLTDSIKLWKYAEHSDARHQKTWFKKYKSAVIIDISQPQNLRTVTKKIRQWYNKVDL